MADAAVPARHTGEGVARRAAFHERLRNERVEVDRHGGAELPAEQRGVRLVDAVQVLDGIPETGPNYQLVKASEGKKKRRERQRLEAAAEQEHASGDASR